MKISKSQLHRILREAFDQKGYDDFIEKFKDEYQQADGSYSGHPDDPRDELASQIRNATKDLYNKKDMYDLEGKSVEELEDILFDLAHSQDQRAMDDMYRDEEEDAIGRDDDLSSAERSPRRQGMRRRPGGSKAQRRMEGINQIVRSALNEKNNSPQAAYDPEQSGKSLVKMVDKVADPNNSPQMKRKWDQKVDQSDNPKYQAQAIGAFMMDYADNDEKKLKAIFTKLKSELPPMMKTYGKDSSGDKGTDKKEAGQDQKSDQPKKITFESSMKIIKKTLRKIIREEIEHMDYNLQAAIDDAKESGASEDEVQTILASSKNTEELIAMLKSMGATYPAPSIEDEE